MTVLEPEVKQDNTLKQEKVDTNTVQQKNEANIAQEQTKEHKSENETQEDPNWRAFREARKKDRAEKEAAERRAAEKDAEVTALKAAMEAAFAKSTPPQTPYQQYYGLNQEVEETEETRFKRIVQQEIDRREAEAEQQRIQREQQEYPQRLARAYPDFHQTISQDNLDYLDYHYPEVSRPLDRLPNGYDKWSDIYQAIKKFVPNNATAKRESAKADANFNKPKSMSTPSITQPGEARSMASMRDVEARRAERYAEMKRIINGVG